MPAVIQIDAAVVSPRTDSPSRMITPAPRKPMPVMIPCAMRVGSIAARISAPGGPEPLRLVDGDEHQRAGREPDQRVGAKAGRAPVVAALDAERAAQRQRHHQPHQDVAEQRAGHRRRSSHVCRGCVSLDTMSRGHARRLAAPLLVLGRGWRLPARAEIARPAGEAARRAGRGGPDRRVGADGARQGGPRRLAGGARHARRRSDGGGADARDAEPRRRARQGEGRGHRGGGRPGCA